MTIEAGELSYAPARPLEELTDAEICALTDEQIQHYRNVAAMELGIALPPQPPELPEKPEIATELVYKVSAQHSDYYVSNVEIACPSMEAASKIAEAIRQHGGLLMARKYVNGENVYTVKAPESITVGAETIMEPKSLASNDAALNAWSSIKKTIEEASKRLTEARKKLANQTEWINEKVSAAREKELTVRAVRGTFAQYLELAKDRETAIKFLAAAYSPEEIKIEAEWGDGKSVSAGIESTRTESQTENSDQAAGEIPY